MRRPAPRSRAGRALRGALVAFVLVGYVLVLGTTASGEGLKLIPHLALEHAPTALHAPHLVGDVEGERDVLRTLRPEAPAPDAPPHAAGGPRTVRVLATPLEALGLHVHGGRLHRHDAPPDAPRTIVTVSLDKHRLPAAPAVPAPVVSSHTASAGPSPALSSVDLSVETPPPIRRG